MGIQHTTIVVVQGPGRLTLPSYPIVTMSTEDGYMSYEEVKREWAKDINPIQKPIVKMIPCHHDKIVDEFTCCGKCLGICFFPIGLVCCFMMREKVCVDCGHRR